MRQSFLGTVTPIACIAAAVIILSGCGETSSTPQSPSLMIQQCLESSGSKLDESLASGDLLAATREIVQVLDDFEDTPAMAPYIEFHEGIEFLENLASKRTSEGELKEVIEQLKNLAADLLSKNAA